VASIVPFNVQSDVQASNIYELTWPLAHLEYVFEDVVYFTHIGYAFLQQKKRLAFHRCPNPEECPLIADGEIPRESLPVVDIPRGVFADMVWREMVPSVLLQQEGNDGGSVFSLPITLIAILMLAECRALEHCWQGRD
jgi:hypothetical protein